VDVRSMEGLATCPTGRGLLPAQVEPPVRSRAVAQVEIDEALVGDAHLLGDAFEVRDSVLVQPNGDLLLQLRGVGVLSGLGEVVFLAHAAPTTGKTSTRALSPCVPK